MSWSISFVGKPDNVVKALEEYATKISDTQCKIEYNSALPHMVGLIKENFGDDSSLVRITANGHGYATAGEQKTRQCAVTIERVYGMLV